MKSSFFAVRRLRVMQQGRAVYDQIFHDGVNIIRGENGSGKSTIADFIFYALGGEFDEWKDSAKHCDEVQAEIETRDAPITLRRAIGTKQEPINLFFGTFASAMNSAFEGWQRLPIRRHGLELSFSQVLFRLSGIPEAQSQKSSNITAHQILRLLYADQRTPASRLFRFESFDTREIRTAVGDLLVGANGYDLYETQIALRSAKSDFSDKKRELDSLFKALPSRDGLIETIALLQEIRDLFEERTRMIHEIEAVDVRVIEGELKGFLEEKKFASGGLRILGLKSEQLQADLTRVSAEALDIGGFISYLEELYAKLKSTSLMSSLIGEIEFSYCPSCLRRLNIHAHEGTCILCSEPLDPEKERARYAHILYDTELQIRENKQLLALKVAECVDLRVRVRQINDEYRTALTFFVAKFGSGNSPREKYLAERNIRLGSISSEVRRIEALLEIAERIDNLNEERIALGAEIDRLEAKERLLNHHTSRRHKLVADRVSKIGTWILRKDLPRQEEFVAAKELTVSFGDDAMFVDNKMNFAESSNVVVKNATLLALISAATHDAEMWHPRFALFDNIEDKGMEEVRSRRFQEIIVEASAAATMRHQIIFTTSMISPELDNSGLCIGEKYTRLNRSLDIDIPV